MSLQQTQEQLEQEITNEIILSFNTLQKDIRNNDIDTRNYTRTLNRIIYEKIKKILSSSRTEVIKEVMGIIGEDEIVMSALTGGNQSKDYVANIQNFVQAIPPQSRNELRYELRAKVKALLEKEIKESHE